MNWTAPKTEHLLEQRLQRARLELKDDARIHGAIEEHGREPLRFIAELIEEKLTAAAKTGFEAAEATLRADATNTLLETGAPVDAVRARLETAGQALRQLLPPDAPRPGDGLMPPAAMAGLLFAAWTTAAVAVWTLTELHPVVCVALVGAGSVPSLWLHRYLDRNATLMRHQVASELPARICRHYMQTLRESVRRYEDAVNEFAGSISVE